MPNSKPKPIPVGGAAVAVAAAVIVVGAVGLIPTATDWVRSARTPPTNNLSGLSPPRQLPRPPRIDDLAPVRTEALAPVRGDDSVS